MQRRRFLSYAAWPLLVSYSHGLSAATLEQPDVRLPASFRGGRPFLNLVTQDGLHVLAWLDTDGSGFMTRALAIHVGSPRTARRAKLPSFRQQVPPVGGDGTLAVIEGASDPILAGVDVQLGGSWFANRTWTINYRTRQIVWHRNGRAITTGIGDRVQMRLQRGMYPVIPVVVNGEVLEMSLDTAASVVDSSGRVAATSFITTARLKKWHAEHPNWRVRMISHDVQEIVVPAVRAGSAELGSVGQTRGRRG